MEGNAAHAPAHGRQSRDAVEAQADRFSRQGLDSQIDTEVRGQPFGVEMPSPEQPGIVETDGATEREEQEVPPRLVADTLREADTMFAREASDAQAEGSSEPDVELGPALDKAASPGEELTTVCRGDRRQGLHKAGVDLLAAMVRHQQRGRRAMGGQCRGGN